jgi:hypothetical protein
MRLVTVYLIVYFALVLGAVFALWAGGALPHIGAPRLAIALAIAIGLGALLAFASARPAADETAEVDER